MNEQNKQEFRKFIISERPNGLDKSVMNHGATYRKVADRNYYSVIEISAVESLKQQLADKEDQYKLAREIASNLEKTISQKDREIAELKANNRIKGYKNLNEDIQIDCLKQDNQKLKAKCDEAVEFLKGTCECIEGTPDNNFEAEYCVSCQVISILNKPQEHSKKEGESPVAQCSVCQRCTWDIREFGSECRMFQPQGHRCEGVFITPKEGN